MMIIISHVIPSQPRGAALKEASNALAHGCLLTAFTPFGSMFNDPIGERALKSDITAGLFGFDPLVPQNFLSLCLELPVERRILQQLTGGKLLFRLI